MDRANRSGLSPKRVKCLNSRLAPGEAAWFAHPLPGLVSLLIEMSLSVDSLLESLSVDVGDDLAAARPPSASSGIGSLGSGLTTYSSESSRSSSPLDCSSPPPPPTPPLAPLRVMYHGRDVLDLGANLLDPRWRLQPTVLPARNLKMYWENRSQYHRLSEFGAREVLRQEECSFPNCSFRTPVPGYEYF